MDGTENNFCSGQDVRGGSMSLLNLLAEVATEKLFNDPTVQMLNETQVVSETKLEPSTVKSGNQFVETKGKPLTLLQVSNMSDTALLRLFSISQSNELKKKFYYTCQLLPSSCEKTTQSFGNEDKARNEMKKHLRNHLRALLQVNNTSSSQENYFLYSVNKQKTSSGNSENLNKKKWSKHDHHKSKGTSNEKENSVNITTTSSLKPNKYYGNSSKVKEIKNALKLIRPNTSETPPISNGFISDHNMFKKVKVSAKPISSESTEENVISSESTEENVNTNLTKSIPTVQTHYTNVNNIEPNDNMNTIEPKNNNLEFKDNNYTITVTSSSNHFTQFSNSQNDENLNKRPSSVDTIISSKKIKTYDTKSINFQQSSYVTVSHDHIYIADSKDENNYINGPETKPNDSIGENSLRPNLDDVSIIQLPKTETKENSEMAETLNEEMEHKNDQNNLEENKNDKQTKGKGKFIGQSKVEKEMALELINQMKSQPLIVVETLECNICDPPRIFTALSTLISHYKSHAGIRPYVCSLCQAVFTRQHSLNYHMLIHSNQTRFTCDDCGRKFRHPSHFKEHRRRHTGESPYGCTDCAMRFKTRNTYKRHLRTRHGKVLTTQGGVQTISDAGDSSPKLIKSESNQENMEEYYSNEDLFSENSQGEINQGIDISGQAFTVKKEPDSEDYCFGSIKKEIIDYDDNYWSMNNNVPNSINPKNIDDNNCKIKHEFDKGMTNSESLISTIESVVNMECSGNKFPPKFQYSNPRNLSWNSTKLQTDKNKIDSVPDPFYNGAKTVQNSINTDKWTNLMTEVLSLSSAVSKGKLENNSLETRIEMANHFNEVTKNDIVSFRPQNMVQGVVIYDQFGKEVTNFNDSTENLNPFSIHYLPSTTREQSPVMKEIKSEYNTVTPVNLNGRNQLVIGDNVSILPSVTVKRPEIQSSFQTSVTLDGQIDKSPFILLPTEKITPLPQIEITSSKNNLISSVPASKINDQSNLKTYVKTSTKDQSLVSSQVNVHSLVASSSKSQIPVTSYSKDQSLVSSQVNVHSLVASSSKNQLPVTSYSKDQSLVSSQVNVHSLVASSSKNQLPVTSYSKDQSLVSTQVNVHSLVASSSKNQLPVTSYSKDQSVVTSQFKGQTISNQLEPRKELYVIKYIKKPEGKFAQLYKTNTNTQVLFKDNLPASTKELKANQVLVKEIKTNPLLVNEIKTNPLLVNEIKTNALLVNCSKPINVIGSSYSMVDVPLKNTPVNVISSITEQFSNNNNTIVDRVCNSNTIIPTVSLNGTTNNFTVLQKANSYVKIPVVQSSGISDSTLSKSNLTSHSMNNNNTTVVNSKYVPMSSNSNGMVVVLKPSVMSSTNLQTNQINSSIVTTTSLPKISSNNTNGEHTVFLNFSKPQELSNLSKNSVNSITQSLPTNKVILQSNGSGTSLLNNTITLTTSDNKKHNEKQLGPTGILSHLLMSDRSICSGTLYYSKYNELIKNMGKNNCVNEEVKVEDNKMNEATMTK